MNLLLTQGGVWETWSAKHMGGDLLAHSCCHVESSYQKKLCWFLCDEPWLNCLFQTLLDKIQIITSHFLISGKDLNVRQEGILFQHPSLFLSSSLVPSFPSFQTELIKFWAFTSSLSLPGIINQVLSQSSHCFSTRIYTKQLNDRLSSLFPFFCFSLWEWCCVGLIHVSGLPVCRPLTCLSRLCPSFSSLSHTSTPAQKHKERDRETERECTKKLVMLKWRNEELIMLVVLTHLNSQTRHSFTARQHCSALHNARNTSSYQTQPIMRPEGVRNKREESGRQRTTEWEGRMNTQASLYSHIRVLLVNNPLCVFVCKVWMRQSPSLPAVERKHFLPLQSLFGDYLVTRWLGGEICSSPEWSCHPKSPQQQIVLPVAVRQKVPTAPDPTPPGSRTAPSHRPPELITIVTLPLHTFNHCFTGKG